MKKTIFVLFISLISFSYASAQTSKVLLTRKWAFKELDQRDLDTLVKKSMAETQMSIDTITDQGERMKTDATMKDEANKLGAEIKELLKGTKMEFKANGTYEVKSSAMEKTEKGKWTLSANGKKLSLVEDAGKKTEMKIIKLTKEELTLFMNDGGVVMHLTMKAVK